MASGEACPICQRDDLGCQVREEASYCRAPPRAPPSRPVPEIMAGASPAEVAAELLAWGHIECRPNGTPSPIVFTVKPRDLQSMGVCFKCGGPIVSIRLPTGGYVLVNPDGVAHALQGKNGERR